MPFRGILHMKKSRRSNSDVEVKEVSRVKRVAVYARRSSDRDTGESIETQIEFSEREINHLNAKSDDKCNIEFHYYKDPGYSGSDTNRPDFIRMIADIKMGKIDVVACYKLDRISRSVVKFYETYKIFDDYGVAFVSAKDNIDTSNSNDKFFMHILVAFAELERDTIRERVIDNMYKLAKSGKWLGGEVPIGYKLRKIENKAAKVKYSILELDEENIKAINDVKFIFEKYLEVGTLSKLETYLMQESRFTAKGSDYATSTLGNILRNPVYVKADDKVRRYFERHNNEIYGETDGELGLMVFGKTKRAVIKGKSKLVTTDIDEWVIAVGYHKGIIESDMWLTVQSMLSENSDTFPHVQRSHTALVSTILRCKCGAAMQVHTRGKDDRGVKFHYYFCTMKRKSKGVRCSGRNVRADKVDMAIKNDLKDMYSRKDVFLSELRENVKLGNQEINEEYDPVEVIEKTIEKRKAQIKNLYNKLSLIEDNDDIARGFIADIRAREAEIKDLHNRLKIIDEKRERIRDTKGDIEYIEAILDKCGDVDNLDLEEQRVLIRALYKRIIWDYEIESLRYVYNNGKKDDGDTGNENDDNNDGGDDDNNGGDNREFDFDIDDSIDDDIGDYVDTDVINDINSAFFDDDDSMSYNYTSRQGTKWQYIPINPE